MRYHPACCAQAQQAFQTFVSIGEVHDVELQVLCRDGSILDVSLSATAVRDAAGKVVRSRSVWRDITARKRAIAEQKRLDAQIRASEVRFATIFHSSPVTLHLTRIATGEIIMTPAEIAALFRPFAQLDNTLARRREGLGIGLAYVYKMAELLGGSVAVASRPEGGSRFTVTLPG